METAQTQKEQMEAAQMRSGVIAPLVQGTYTDASMAACCRRAAPTPQRLPDGRVFRYKPKTAAKWYQPYERGGMEALVPRTRCDKGAARVIPEEAERGIRRLRKEYPRLNAARVREKPVQEGTLPAAVSVSAVQRYIKRNGLKGPEDTSVKDRKAYEGAYFGGMRQAGTCCLPYIRENGKSRRVYLVMILAGHSRMIVGGKLYYQENAADFQKTLKDAVAAYGIPDKLYADNGSPHSNEQPSLTCGSVGTVLLHTPVRDGAGKGKAERDFRTLKERRLHGLDISRIQGLEGSNRLLSEYIRTHNATKHGGTGESPLGRYMASNGRIRRPRSREWLEEAFHNRVIRNVNRDAAVRLLNGCHDAPMQSIGQKAEVRFLPGGTGSACIPYGGRHYPLRLADRAANGRTKRQAGLSIDYAKGGRGDVH